MITFPSSSPRKRRRFVRSCLGGIVLGLGLTTGPVAGAPAEPPVPPDGGGPAPTVLFVGNSLIFAAGSPVRYYRSGSVTDLNGTGVGGVPALFQAFATQAGLRFAVTTGVADADPYDGIGPGLVNLWAHDNHHGSSYGYYLEALVVFGTLTGLDPRSLGEREQCAFDLGLAKEEASRLQQVAYAEFVDQRGPGSLKAFARIAIPHP